jgi:DNA (cytosine-5)-methyltransferase 1
MNELALFAGIGGGILGSRLLGWKTVCAVEINAFCCRRLMQRQNEGHLPPFPVWDDVYTFDGRPWKGIIDVVSGGFPCQDISVAGKGAGINGKRSGLWKEMARIIGEVRPQYVFVENSPALLIRGIDRVLGDLVKLGYDCKWGIFSGENVGAPIERKRIFITCTNSVNRKTWLGGIKNRAEKIFEKQNRECSEVWSKAPSIPVGMGNGLGGYVDRVTAIGNGQIPQVVKLAWETLS